MSNLSPEEKKRMQYKRWSYDLGVSDLRKAYDAAREPFQNDLERLDRSFKDHRDRLSDCESGEDRDNHHWYEEHLLDQHWSLQSTLRLVREGFAVILYHYWERRAQGWHHFSNDKYQYGTAYKQLPPKGYLVDKGGLEKLRNTVNVIKHDSNQLYGKHKDMFSANLDEVYNNGNKKGYYSDLNVKDSDLDYFFDVIKRSGPDAEPRLGF